MAVSLSEMIAAPTLSLVKYETPTLVTTRDSSEKGSKRESRFPSIREKPSSARSSKESKSSKDPQAAEILDTILPPREYEEDGKLWVQPVSRTPATRLDVVNLAERLDRLLVDRHAREIGICPIRRELYDQCFDELIRQETLNCVERGLLFVRVRDELRMTLAAYETLYDSGVSFGIRKALMSEKGKMSFVEKLEMLTLENEDLRKQLRLEEARYNVLQKEWEQLRAAENKQLGEKIELLERSNSQLKIRQEDPYAWYSSSITPIYYKDYYLRKAMLSMNASRAARVRNLLHYPTYRLPAIRVTPVSPTRYNLYRKRARNLSIE